MFRSLVCAAAITASALSPAAASAPAPEVAVQAGPASVASTNAAGLRTPLVAGLANPGVRYDTTARKWIIVDTGGWDSAGSLYTSTDGIHDWTKTGKKLLDRQPAWSSTTDHSYWAPSTIRSTDGRYFAYFSAVVKGNTSGRRCIGVGVSSTPTGPFTPNARPLACWTGSGTNPIDAVPGSEAGTSLIDATATYVGADLVLTYKVQSRVAGKWHSVIRMLKLNPASPGQVLPNPVNSNGNSVVMTSTTHEVIEENPVIALRKGKYTLFTSWGLYGTCDYVTRYRQSTDLWRGWGSQTVRNLTFPATTNTCGTGNAHVIVLPGSDTWRIYFNGHQTRERRSPFGMYVGAVTWNTANRPVVSSINNG